MFESPFSDKPKFKIDPDSQIIFVADLFVEEYTGGAELTTQALIDKSPHIVQKIKSRDVTIELLEEGYQKYWIFGNFSGMNMELVPTIVANLKYSVLEYDYKYCRYRSTEKHKFSEMEDCNCHNEMSGKMISAFYYAAQSLWWMSEDQMDHYFSLFPFLEEKENTVLSSVFDDRFFLLLKELREKHKSSERTGWIVLGSNSWIKGADNASKWCEENNLQYESVWDIPYAEVLDKLAQAEGFVYLPNGKDTCPRMVIEAKLLGCKLHLNDDVQHSNELWFDTDDLFDTESYLYASREKFWNSIMMSMNWQPTLSGYTTTKDCISQDYPWRQCIQSMLGFSDEVIVVDGGSTDGTWEDLEKWAELEVKLKVYKVERDWSHPRHAVFDGLQKAEARKRCTSQFLWQMDADEIVHEDDYDKIINLCKNFPRNTSLVSLPVIEYWGSLEKVRMDINPWKWRLSINSPEITHGIPAHLRKHDENGEMYAAPGTDGCDYIHSSNGQLIPHASFYTEEVDVARRQALSNNPEALENYQRWFNNVIEQLPGVHHYSWMSISRKIKTYKNYWQRHWESLYDIHQEDTAENNMFFSRPWASVTDKDIEEMSTKLAKEMGGWIFHSPVDFSKPTPHVVLERSQPNVMSKTDDDD